MNGFHAPQSGSSVRQRQTVSVEASIATSVRISIKCESSGKNVSELVRTSQPAATLKLERVAIAKPQRRPNATLLCCCGLPTDYTMHHSFHGFSLCFPSLAL